MSVATVLPLAFGLDLKEKRLMRRREKLPDFFLGAELALAFGKSSWDWLRPASFCLLFLRKMSLVPLRRKFTAAGENRERRQEPHQSWGETGRAGARARA